MRDGAVLYFTQQGPDRDRLAVFRGNHRRVPFTGDGTSIVTLSVSSSTSGSLSSTLGESVTEATVGKWFKKAGEAVAVDEPLVELETDKVTIEVPAPAAGVLAEIVAKDGETVAVGALLGPIGRRRRGQKPARTAGRRRRPSGAEAADGRSRRPPPGAGRRRRPRRRPPSVRRLAAESGVDAADRAGTGKDGRVTKGDVLAAIERAAAQPTPVAAPAAAVRARAVAGRRRRARGARAHDAAAPDHRAPPQGSAEHRRHAHDLQRGGHDRGDGAARRSTRTCSRRSTA